MTNIDKMASLRKTIFNLVLIRVMLVLRWCLHGPINVLTFTTNYESILVDTLQSHFRHIIILGHLHEEV